MDSDNSYSFCFGSREPLGIHKVFIASDEKPAGLKGQLVYRTILDSLGNLGYILVLAAEEMDDGDIEILVDEESKLKSRQGE